MVQLNNLLKIFTVCYLIFLQASVSWCKSLSQSVVQVVVNGNFRCAGTAIKPNVVVTAASCVENVTVTDITVGNAAGGSQNVIQFTIHPQYKPKTSLYNVVVLVLAANLDGVTPAPTCNDFLVVKNRLTVYSWNPQATPPVSSHNFRVTSGLDLVTNNYGSLPAIGTKFCFADKGGPVEYKGRLCGIVSVGGPCPNAANPLYFDSVMGTLPFINKQLPAV